MCGDLWWFCYFLCTSCLHRPKAFIFKCCVCVFMRVLRKFSKVFRRAACIDQGGSGRFGVSKSWPQVALFRIVFGGVIGLSCTSHID